VSRFGRKKAKPRKPKRESLRIVRESRRVCILTPCDDTVKTEFAASLVDMVMHTLMSGPENLEGLAVQAFGSTILPYSREQLAECAIRTESTHMLWIDSDMKFPKDMLLRFLRRDEKIIGINAMSRRVPYRNCAQTDPATPLVTTDESSGLEKVYRMGFGVLWVETAIVKAMPVPRFDFEYIPDLKAWRGEDFVFFERAREQGHDFYVDHDLSKEVFHMGSFGFNPVMMGEIGAHTISA
jgi:hypothetical protein